MLAALRASTIMKMVDLTLPAFAFLDAHVSDKDELEGRNVILHVRSMSVVEIFERQDVVFNDDVLTYKFFYTNNFGVKESYIAALHFCATLDKNADRNMIKEEIMKPAAIWYCDYLKWEDNNIINGL